MVRCRLHALLAWSPEPKSTARDSAKEAQSFADQGPMAATASPAAASLLRAPRARAPVTAKDGEGERPLDHSTREQLVWSDERYRNGPDRAHGDDVPLAVGVKWVGGSGPVEARLYGDGTAL
jgi:hypothetical protein